MKRLVIAIAILAITSINAFAESDEIECVSGECSSWRGKYETVSGSVGTLTGKYSGSADYIFYNTTDKPAFNIKIVIDFYDYMGEHIERLQIKEEGPIHKQIAKRGPWPRNASRLTFNVYATNDLHGEKTIDKAETQNQ